MGTGHQNGDGTTASHEVKGTASELFVAAGRRSGFDGFEIVQISTATRIQTSSGRSLAGTSLAPGTSARPIVYFQEFVPRFRESLGPADTSGSPPFGQSLATLTIGGTAV